MLDGKHDSEVVENLGTGKLFENRVGALFVQCFFSFLFFIFDGILLASNFLLCIHFPADSWKNHARLREK